MDIISRAEWGARNANSPGGTSVALSERRYGFLHYSLGEELGRADTYAWVREIQAFHMGPSRGWADIGYNFLADNSGRLFEGRGWDRVGAHCPGFNTNGLAVCFLGDDDPGVTDVSAAAKTSIRWLFEEWDRKCGRGLLRKGHRDGKPTGCPGDELYHWLHSGMPLDAVVPMPPPVRPSPPSQPAPPIGSAPAFVLPRGYYFGPKSGPPQSVSGYYHRRSNGRVGHDGLFRWQYRMKQRGWTIFADGRYGPNTADVARRFQAEKKLGVDGKIGPKTWAAAWNAPVT